MALIDPTKLHLEPGDIVVVRVPDAMTLDEMEFIVDEARRLFPNNRTLVLDRGITIERVSTERLRELLGTP